MGFDERSAQHLARRNELLEELDRRARRGDNRFTDRGDNVTPLQTTASIAAELGFDERSAQHLARRNELLEELDRRAQSGDNRFTDRGDNVTPLQAQTTSPKFGL